MSIEIVILACSNCKECGSEEIKQYYTHKMTNRSCCQHFIPHFYIQDYLVKQDNKKHENIFLNLQTVEYSQEDSFLCPNHKRGCLTRFDNHLELNHHMLSGSCSSGSFVCTHCKQYIIRESSNQHIENCVDSLIPCLFCNIKVPISGILDHYQSECAHGTILAKIVQRHSTSIAGQISIRQGHFFLKTLFRKYRQRSKKPKRQTRESLRQEEEEQKSQSDAVVSPLHSYLEQDDDILPLPSKLFI